MGYNRKLAGAVRRGVTGVSYLRTRRGPLSTPALDVLAFFRALPESERPDAQVLLAPYSRGLPFDGQLVERHPGLTLTGFVLRPTSEGSVRISSSDPAAAPRITANYLSTEHDRRISVAMFRRMREIIRQPPISDMILGETLPGVALRHAEDILTAGLLYGGPGYHACGTCAMGPDDEAPVDSQLRVRGVEGLHAMDASILPTMVSGNLNGPIMAMAWHGADVIRATG
jgi:choline dehydrogenase-like flavoprotein